MSSPFSDNANGLLIFSAATSQYQTDPETGNQIPIAGTLELMVKLTPKKNTPVMIDLSGGDQVELVMTGRGVDPMYFPPEVGVGAMARCVITDLFTGNEQQGRFEVTAITQSAFAAVTEVLGTGFEGKFIADKVGAVLYA
jgi:hypothetical protein